MTYLAACELTRRGMACLVKENRDEFEGEKHRRPPQLQNDEMFTVKGVV